MTRKTTKSPPDEPHTAGAPPHPARSPGGGEGGLWPGEGRAPILKVSNLRIERDGTVILDDVSWRVQHGEHWVILGANGSGKTSLLSALTGYLMPTAGEISLLGETYGQSDWRGLRKKVGLVSSSVRQRMADGEPALETVASGKYAMIDFWGRVTRAEKAAASKLLRSVECDYLADRPWGVLSQGERQRVLVARALMAKPRVLILDEPCAGLDPAAREHFLQFLQRLGAQKKIADTGSGDASHRGNHARVFSSADLETRTRAGGGRKPGCPELKKSFPRVWFADAIAPCGKSLCVECHREIRRDDVSASRPSCPLSPPVAPAPVRTTAHQPVLHPVINALPRLLAFQDSRCGQQRQVLGPIRLRGADGRHDVVDRARGVADGLQNFQTHRFAQHFETGGGLRQLVRRHGGDGFFFAI